MPNTADNSSDRLLHPTHAEKDSKGDWLGFEGRLALYPIASSFAGLFVFSVLYSFKKFPILPTLPICFIPAVVVTTIVLTLVNKKPPGHLRDWIATMRGQASMSYTPSRTRHPLASDE